MDFFIADAMAQGGAGTGAGLTGLLFPIALIVIFYFLLIRPQQKRAKEHKKLVQNLARGDEIMTSGGICGRIIEVGESFVTLDIANGVEVRIQKQAAAQVLPKGTLKQKLAKADSAGGDAKGKAGKKGEALAHDDAKRGNKGGASAQDDASGSDDDSEHTEK